MCQGYHSNRFLSTIHEVTEIPRRISGRRWRDLIRLERCIATLAMVVHFSFLYSLSYV
jgi:hypothetical protein